MSEATATVTVPAPTAPERICIVGSGNFGSTIAKIVGENVHHFDKFDKTVTMWVFEEMVNGRKLTEIINNDHENVKYLPGHKIPTNVLAVPDLKEAAKGATLLIFVLPHQFLPRLFGPIKEGVGEEALATGRVKAISLIKGIDYDDKGLVLISDTILKGLGCDTSVLMGANVAGEVAEGQFCEATIGYTPGRLDIGDLWRDVFDTDYFRIGITEDKPTVELCGALKNVVALAAGFCDGLGFGGNTKAAMMRIGLLEMMHFIREFYPGAGLTETLLESCGVADLITTCFGGRNRKCAEAFAKTGRSWDEIEAELLGGQKLQGTLTAKEVNTVLSRAGAESQEKYPLFNMIYKIMMKELPCSSLTELQRHRPREELAMGPRNPGETVEAHMARHEAELAARRAAGNVSGRRFGVFN